MTRRRNESPEKFRHLTSPAIVLASTSPRRQAILKSLGFPFTVIAPFGEEETSGEAGPSAVAIGNAKQKMTSVLDRMESPDPTLVIGADTVVALDGELLGKPGSEDEARRHLARLSGRRHEVITGLALRYGDAERAVGVMTGVIFRDLKESEIEAYVRTGEPMDKAGAYAIQGLACRFVREVRGSYTNVVGFPVEAFLDELETLTGIPAYQWVRR